MKRKHARMHAGTLLSSFPAILAIGFLNFFIVHLQTTSVVDVYKQSTVINRVLFSRNPELALSPL